MNKGKLSIVAMVLQYLSDAVAQSQYRPGASAGRPGGSGGLVEAMEALLEMMLASVVTQVVQKGHWRKQFQGFLERITQYLAKFPSHPSSVMGRLMVGTMRTQRPSAKHSISAGVMGMVASTSTASCVLTELCSTSSTLCVTGGSMLTVP